MKKFSLLIITALLLILSARLGGETMFIDKDTQDGVREYLQGKYGEDAEVPHRARRAAGGVLLARRRRRRRGVRQILQTELYRRPRPAADPVSAHRDQSSKSLYGHLNRISLDLKRPLHLDQGEILPIDERFGQFDPGRPRQRRHVRRQDRLRGPTQLPGLHPGRKNRAGPGLEPARLGLRPLRRPVPFPPAGPRQPERRRRLERSRDLHLRIQHLHGATGRQPGQSPVSRRT